MIRKLIASLILLAIGGFLTWYALAHHIVTTADGRVVVPKAELSFTDTFVDITAWSASDALAHKHVAKALVDHGHAGAMFVIGGGVKGGKVHGRWPGLEREQLFEGRDLALTTDFRAVFSEILSKHMGAESLPSIFPGFEGKRLEWLGVL